MSDFQAAHGAAEAKRLLSAREAAARLGISRPTLSRLIRAKRIGVYRVGARTLFDDAILENYKSTVYEAPVDARNIRRRKHDASVVQSLN